MILSPVSLAFYLSWGVTVLGVALWVWSWVRVRDPIDRLRFQDCGIVLVFAAILTRVIIQRRAGPLGPLALRLRLHGRG